MNLVGGHFNDNISQLAKRIDVLRLRRTRKGPNSPPTVHSLRLCISRLHRTLAKCTFVFNPTMRISVNCISAMSTLRTELIYQITHVSDERFPVGVELKTKSFIIYLRDVFVFNWTNVVLKRGFLKSLILKLTSYALLETQKIWCWHIELIIINPSSYWEGKLFYI